MSAYRDLSAMYGELREEALCGCRVAVELRLLLDTIKRGEGVSDVEIESAEKALADLERVRAKSDAALIAALGATKK